MLKKIGYGFLFSVLAFVTLSCQSVPETVDQDWSEEMFFRSAQDAVDAGKLEKALFYYEVFLVRYPENHEKGIAAEYERAILHKKLGAEDLALQEMKAVMDKYENSPYVTLYPPRYKVLGEKIILILEGSNLPEVDPEKYPERVAPPQ